MTTRLVVAAIFICGFIVSTALVFWDASSQSKSIEEMRAFQREISCFEGEGNWIEGRCHYDDRGHEGR
ncbi:hypothetical protein [Pararhodobacter marinus]|uniref:hypothetical protein n=1 Tax=Pararhodobacter marinus TaxID=2184063 RepID=UPI003512374A